MTDPATTADLLERAGTRTPDEGYTFVADDGSEEFVSFGRLLRRSHEIAQVLTERGLKSGDRVGLILSQFHEFIQSFFGVIAGGGVPVPLYPPMGLRQLGSYLDHSTAAVRSSGARLLITTNQIRGVLGTVHQSCPALRAILTLAELEGDAALFRGAELKPDDVALVQFTSGSTSQPRGVVLTHRNVMANTLAITIGLRIGGDDRGVSWLPLYHDMGLIGFVLAPMYATRPTLFLSPLRFLKRPASWLQAVTRFRGTVTYAPNFGYALCVSRVPSEEIHTLDLSCVRVAGSGAEPIQAETLRAFARRFGECGFREEAFVPSYGMAESTLAISFSRGISAERIRSSPLWEDGRADLAGPDDTSAVEIVGCGRPFPGHALKVVHAETADDLPERYVGEIWVRGPSVARSFSDGSEVTGEAMRSDGWLRTGDLGYVADGQVYICGRKKDLIIVHGRNYYPQDLEWATSRVRGIRAGGVVAFSSFHAALDREAVVVVAETRQAEGREQLADEVRDAVHVATRLVADHIVLVDVGTIPKTTSGKLQRARCRALYESDTLGKGAGKRRLRSAERQDESRLAHLRLGIFRAP